MALTIFTRSRLLCGAALLLAASGFSAPAAFAQQEGPDEPDNPSPGYSSLNVAQPKGTRELQNALQRLALNPGDIDALIDGGNAALLLGDPQAAIGFFARADQMAPGNGRVKAGLGSGLLLNENPYEALRLFDEAKKLGVPETVFAADRGLAYDLVGNADAAQADYELAMRRGADDETIRRYALSLGISGDRSAAEAQLDPLLRKRDAAAWRTRAFVLAVTGDPEGAIAIADATMPKRMAASIEPFFRFMGRLTPAQQAAAAHFGHFPQSAAIGKDDPRNRQYASAGTPRVRTGRADSGLIPVGEPLGATASAQTRRTAKVDKAQRRRPGKLTSKEQAEIAAAQTAAASKPVPVQARAPGPVPPSDLLIPGRGVAGNTQIASASTVTRREIVQPLPAASAPATASERAPTPAPAPTPTSGPASATVTRLTELPAPTRPSGGMPAVQPSVRSATVLTGVTELPRPGTLPKAAQTPTPAPASASASTQVQPLPPTESTPAADAPPVRLAGVGRDVRPGFTSLATNAQAAPAPATPSPAPQNILPVPMASSPPAPAPSPGGLIGPVQGPGFDLASIGQSAPAPVSPVPTAPAPSPTVAAPTGSALMVARQSASPEPSASVPARVSLASVIADIKVPPQELAPNEDAVDITKIKPATPKPAEAKKPEPKKPEPKKAEAKPAPPKHPKRYWVQVAGGANRADLAKEWKRLTGTAPAAFKGKQGWWTPLNATNRLLAGPFASDKEAQGFVNTLSKEKLSGFTFTSSEGQEVTKLGG